MATATLLPFPVQTRLRLTPLYSFHAESGIGPAVAILFAHVVDGIDRRRSQATAHQQHDQGNQEDGSRA